MGRKNSNVRHANDKGRRARQQREQVPAQVTNKQYRVGLEDMVLPDGQCRFQSPRKPKARFATPELAAKALRQAQAQRRRVGSTHMEKRYFACPEGGCGGYHLTSRETFDEQVWALRRRQYEERTTP